MLAGDRRRAVVIDVCLMGSDGAVVREAEFDARRALDRRGTDGKFDGEEARIASTVAYAEACVDELGEIPFFQARRRRLRDLRLPRLDADPDHGDRRGRQRRPAPSEQVTQCDDPQYIYSLCEPATAGRRERPTQRPARRPARSNEQGTHWVLLCRKAKNEQGAVQRHRHDRDQPVHGQDLLLPERALLPHRRPARAAPRRHRRVGALAAAVGEPVVGHPRRPRQRHRVRRVPRHRPVHPLAVDRRRARRERRPGGAARWASTRTSRSATTTRPTPSSTCDGQGWTMPQQLVSRGRPRVHALPPHRQRPLGQQLDRAAGRRERRLDQHHHRGVPRLPAHLLDAAGRRRPRRDDLLADSDYGQAVRHIQHCADNPSDPAASGRTSRATRRPTRAACRPST